ncbi:hypothetical protein ACPOL_0296 [Acidisarcina polymorpha]|uniref:Uncharacterized protein n=1 Tax=Acidisarcina polymorpha TaxID=2211140 RepID=A0A2Z5FSB2_9BACT|nr:hypothetical protein ACPOL_0296 [Acidisarcina polymorpha]
MASLATAVQGLSICRLHFVEASILTTCLLCSVALAIIGPGAYSCDARFFGRRRITFHDDH